jgi:hypothetical protein
MRAGEELRGNPSAEAYALFPRAVGRRAFVGPAAGFFGVASG